jgi:heme iron utilization protein
MEPSRDRPADPPATPDAPADLPTELVASAIEHMNTDHGDAVLACARGLAGLDWATAAELVAIDGAGIDLAATDGQRRAAARVDFPAPLEAPGELHLALVALVRAARAAGG